MTLPAMVFWALAAVALVASAWRPWVVAALYVALIAPTSSLPWQLGFANVSLPFVVLTTLLAGLAVRFLAIPRRSRTAPPASARAAATAALVTVAVATLVSLVRDLAPGDASILGRDLWAQIVGFNPGGLAGRLQAALIYAAAPLLVLLSPWIDRPRRVLAAAPVGFGLLLLAPLLQAGWMDTIVRPDLGLYEGTGLVGFLQDPHSYAAALLLAAGSFAGLALAFHRAERRPALPLLFVALALASSVAVVLTGSRAGTMCLLVVVVAFLVMASPSLAAVVRRPRSWVAVGVVGIIVGVAVSTPVPTLVSAVGSTSPGSSAPAGTSLLLRSVPWHKGVLLSVRQPIAGIGPGTFATAVVPMDNPAPEHISPPEFVRYLGENAHNYFLQVAAELGLPGLAAFLALFLLATASLHAVARRERGSSRQAILSGVLAAQAGVLCFTTVSHPFLLAEIQGMYWLIATLVLRLPEASGPPVARPGNG